MKTASIALLVVIALIALAEAQHDKNGRYEIEIIPDVKYTQGDYKPQTMDIIRPKGQLEKPMPVLVWIHGGAWAAGNQVPGRERSKPFAEKGYFCATITYRLSPDSSFPAHIEDCKCAIRFLRANAKKFNIDPECIGVWGDSAGGHLSALLGTSGGAKNLEGNRGWAGFSSRVQAVCDFFGPSDITKMGHKEQIISSFLGGPLKDNLNKAREASPVTYVSQEDPPFLIIHGNKDTTVPIEQSEILKKALEKVGVPVEMIVLNEASHGGPDFQKPEVVEKTMEFFDKNLGMDKRGTSQTGTQTPVAIIQSTSKAEFVMKTFIYKQVGNLKIQADVHRANDAIRRPVLVWLHGGGLITGGRKGVLPDILELCRSEGYVLVSADYRLAPEAKLPQIIEDLQDLMTWVNDKGPVLFGADPKNIVVAGQSAGGYLTMMAGICKIRPKALVSYWGYGDVDGAWYSQPSSYYCKNMPLVSREDAYKGMSSTILTETQGGTEIRKARQQLYLYLRQNGLWTKEVTGFDPNTEKKKLDPYCPVRNITANYPPILMIHGTNDQDVPCQESLDMAEQLKQKGVRYELITVPGAGHMLSGGNKEQVAKAYARAREFIKENLGSDHVAKSELTIKPGTATATGLTLAYSTFLGGADYDAIRGMTTDSECNVYVAGPTTGQDFPTTPGAYQRNYSGGITNSFVAKLNPRGRLVWSTRFGGKGYGDCYPYTVALDRNRYVYIGGRANLGLPTTPGVFQPDYLGFSGGPVHGSNNAFVAKFTPDGSRLVWASYVGTMDGVRDIKVDSNGDVYAGTCYDPAQSPAALPVEWFANGYQKDPKGGMNAYVLKISSDGAKVLAGTYLAGSDRDSGNIGIALSALGEIYVAFATRSPNMPTTNGYKKTPGGGWDLYVAKLSSDLSELL